MSGGEAPEGENEGGGHARFAGVLACFFLSGFAALIYQTAWTRQFAFVFGTSELAVATVLAAYMGGLAAGAALAARYAARVTRPILVYGVIELGIAVSALAVPLGITIAQTLYLALFGAAGEPPGEGGLETALFYLACSFVILFPATALMGATLPLLARYAVRSESEIGSRIGALYTANTVGAVAGTSIAGFLLLPTLGLGATLATAVVGNALVFGLAALLARNAPSVAAEGSQAEVSRSERNTWILPLIAVSGSVSFLYEVLWTRMLGNILGGSVYAFATMLGTFLTGIALGSWVASRLASDRARSIRGFAIAQLGTAALALGAFEFADSLPELARSLGKGVLSDAALCALVLLPSTVFIGATFPFAVRIHARNEHDAATGSAHVYSWNTLGSIVGAVGAGFFLVPALGFAGSMTLAVALNLLLAVAAVARMQPHSRVIGVTACIGLLLLAVFPPESPLALLSSSPLSQRPASGKLIHFAVGRSSTVQVRDRTGTFGLFTNGLQEAIIEPPGASFAFSPLVPWMAGLPVLTRPHSRSMLVVGLGGGGVAEAIPSTFERVDVVELEPEVVEANRLLSNLRSIDPLADPRIHITTNDARGSLLLTQRSYDAIVSQPSHPWTAGASHLYTREFFQLARDRLTEDGVLLQWMGLPFVDESLLQVLVASLFDVFDHVNLYAPIHGGVLLLASDEALTLDERASQAIAAAPGDFVPLGVVGLEDVAAARIFDTEAARSFAAGAPINTDDRNLLQTRSPAIARERKVTVKVESLALRDDPLSRGPSAGSALPQLRSLLRLGYAKRAAQFAEGIDNPATKAAADALLSAYNSRSASKTRALFAQAVALNPNADALKLDALQASRRVLLRGDAELSALADSMRDPYAAVAEGWRRVGALDPRRDAELRDLLPRLESCPATEPCFRPALRLRARALLASSTPQDARAALELLDRYGSLLKERSDHLLHARAALAAGRERAALAMLFLVERSTNKSSNKLIATAALKVIEELPDELLGQPGRQMEMIFRRMAAGQRGERAR